MVTKFIVGKHYTREQVAAHIEMPADRQGEHYAAAGSAAQVRGLCIPNHVTSANGGAIVSAA